MYETEDLIAAILPKLVRITGAGDNVSAGCPFPDHEDRNASFSFNKKTGLGKCHGSCGWKGNAYQLARALGCLPVSQTRRKSRAVIDWGLDAAMSKYGVIATSTGVSFRITDHAGNRCRDHIRRHEGEPRFYYGKGDRTYHAWVSWDLVWEWGDAAAGIAYVVEGDRDALTLAAHGWPSIGILGIDHFDHARRDIVEPLKDAGIGALVLTPDNDDAGIAAVTEWAPKLEGDGFLVGVRTLPTSISGVGVKDIFDAYSANRAGFDDLIFDLPVHWRA